MKKAILLITAMGILDCTTDNTLCESGDTLLFGPTYPDNSIVTECWIDVSSTFTSGGDATILIEFATDGANCIDAASALSTTDWNAAAPRISDASQAGTPCGQLTAARQMQATFAAFNVTAGVLRVYCSYLPGI